VATPSALVLRVVERLLVLLGELRLPVRGMIENMAAGDAGGAAVAAVAARHSLELLGCIPYLPEIEGLLASPDPLAGPLGGPLARIAGRLAAGA
jgi:Mrp family chromosome partitioning ATPase